MEEGKNKGTELADRLSDPETVKALTNLVDRLTELSQTGVLDSFFQTVQAVTFMKDGLTDTMVNKNAAMASTLGEIASEAASPEILDTVREVKKIHRAGKVKDLFDLTDTIAFMLNSTTEKMIERNAVVMEKLYAMADEAAAPETLAALKTLKELQRSGNLDKLAEAAYMISFMTNAATDSMVQRMASFVSAFVEEVSTPDVTDILRNTTKCVLSTIAQFSHEPPKKGLGNVISTMRDPEVQKGMIFMATLAKNMQKCMLEAYSSNHLQTRLSKQE
ncbi:MAG: DUF1641 domain-containing protein [Actinomycetota bacterium]|nr:DUF1641 domain-containing protein [Actinomycetota bacterium]